MKKQLEDALERSYSQGKVYAALEIYGELLKICIDGENSNNVTLEYSRGVIEKLVTNYKSEYEEMR